MSSINSIVPDFRNQVVIITGASSGIGKAIASRLMMYGAQLCLVGRSQEKLKAVAERTGNNISDVKYYLSDLSSDEDLQSLISAISRDFSSIDILIHSAGIICFGQVDSAPVEDLDKQYRINVRAPYLLTQAMLPLLKPNNGQIVFINSSVSLTNGKANLSQYCATKYALKAISDSLRKEMNPEGIRVLSVYPGRTASPMQATVHEIEGKPYHPELLIQPEDIAESVVNALSSPRDIEVNEISATPVVTS